MAKHILAGCILALMIAIPRLAAASARPTSVPGSGMLVSSSDRVPLTVASSRDLASMTVAPRDDGADSGDDGGDDGDDDGGH